MGVCGLRDVIPQFDLLYNDLTLQICKYFLLTPTPPLKLVAALKMRARAVFTFCCHSTIWSADNPDKLTRLSYYFNCVTLSSVALLWQIYLWIRQELLFTFHKIRFPLDNEWQGELIFGKKCEWHKYTLAKSVSKMSKMWVNWYIGGSYISFCNSQSNLLKYRKPSRIASVYMWVEV